MVDRTFAGSHTALVQCYYLTTFYRYGLETSDFESTVVFIVVTVQYLLLPSSMGSEGCPILNMKVLPTPPALRPRLQ